MIDAAEPEHAQPDFDSRAEQLARVYAQAFLDTARGAGRVDELVAELDAVVEEILDRFPKFEALLNSGLVSLDDKLAILDRVLKDRASTATLDFLRVVSEHGRLDILRSIHHEAHTLFDEARGVVRVLATTATALGDDQKEKLLRSLRRMTGGEPVAEFAVDPALIGGVVLRIGDTVFDGSLARQLEKMREKMINRSVHEIQSRRDSFRHSDGN